MAAEILAAVEKIERRGAIDLRAGATDLRAGAIDLRVDATLILDWLIALMTLVVPVE